MPRSHATGIRISSPVIDETRNAAVHESRRETDADPNRPTERDSSRNGGRNQIAIRRKYVCVCHLRLCSPASDHWPILPREVELTKLRRPLLDPEIEKLPQSQNTPQGQLEPEQTTRSRQIQRRMDARLQMAEAQKTLARAMEKNARYMLLSTIIAGLTTILAVATIVFEVFVGFPRPPH